MSHRTQEILAELTDVNVYNLPELVRRLDHPDDRVVESLAEREIHRGEFAPATVYRVLDAVLALNAEERKPVAPAKPPRPAPVRAQDQDPAPAVEPADKAGKPQPKRRKG